MKYFFLLWICVCGFAQIPSYYNNIDFTASPASLKSQLSNLVITTHTNITNYQQLWAILQETDKNPQNSAQVLLFYGYNDADGDVQTDRTRDINNYGGGIGQWNREHVYPKSLGNPDLGTTGPGADPHMIRACDVNMNSERGNLPFVYGNGIASGYNGSNGFYPGDEWKGDVARIIMYMYLRYGTRCLPNVVAAGSSNSYSPEMPDIFLTWNSEDPVSAVEIQRNNYLNTELGNRNPFIDNPYLATMIWGGPEADNTWNLLAEDLEKNSYTFSISPNPVQNQLYINGDFKSAEIYTLGGKKIKEFTQASIDISDLNSAIYLITITDIEGQKETLKFIKN